MYTELLSIYNLVSILNVYTHVQVHLATDKLGQSVDECDALLKKHEAFERLITSQEEKVCILFHLYSETPW